MDAQIEDSNSSSFIADLNIQNNVHISQNKDVFSQHNNDRISLKKKSLGTIGSKNTNYGSSQIKSLEHNRTLIQEQQTTSNHELNARISLLGNQNEIKTKSGRVVYKPQFYQDFYLENEEEYENILNQIKYPMGNS